MKPFKDPVVTVVDAVIVFVCVNTLVSMNLRKLSRAAVVAGCSLAIHDKWGMIEGIIITQRVGQRCPRAR